MYQTVWADSLADPSKSQSYINAARPSKGAGHPNGGRSGPNRYDRTRTYAPGVHGMRSEKKHRERNHKLNDIKHQDPTDAKHRELKRCDSRGSTTTFYSRSGSSILDSESLGESRMGRSEKQLTEYKMKMKEVLEETEPIMEYKIEHLPDGSVFEGQFRGLERHGRGTFTWSDGGSYAGQFDSNDMHGEGTYVWCDGSTFYGQWQHNEMGPDGVMKWPDGRKYHGQFRGGKKHGEGRLTWPDGRSYEGQWEAGKQHGVGITKTETGFTHKSQWEHGTLVSPLPA